MQMLSSCIIFALLAGVVLSQTTTTCQHAFIVYNDMNGTEVLRLDDAKYPAQFSVDEATLRDIAQLRVLAFFCNNNPLYQSAYLVARNLTAPFQSPPTIDESFVNDGPPVTINGNFLKVPGSYQIEANSHSQNAQKGFPLDSLTVAVQVYASCQRRFILYRTDKQREIASFPDFGFRTSNSNTKPDSATSQGAIDLVELGTTRLNMVFEFCNPLVQNVTFSSVTDGTLSVSRVRPFTIGPKGRRLWRTKILSTPTVIGGNLGPIPFTGNAQGRIDSMSIYLTIAPPFKVVSFTLIDADTGTDLVQSVVVQNYVFEEFSNLAVDLSIIPATTSFAIRANTVGNVSSIDFKLTTGDLPFILASNVVFDGISSTGAFNLSSPGSFYLDATPYDGVNLTGIIGPNHNLFVTVLAKCRVTGLSLIDTTTNNEVSIYTSSNPNVPFSPQSYHAPLYEFDPFKYPANATFGLRAVTEGYVMSLEYKLFHVKNLQGESELVSRFVTDSPPFCYGGVDLNSYCNPVSIFQSPGNISSALTNYKLFVTPYDGINMQGNAGPTTEFGLNVLPSFKITSFSVVNATSGNVLFDVDPSNAVLDLSQFPEDTRFTIRASTAGNVGSIAFKFSPYYLDDSNELNRFENEPPFTVGGMNGQRQLLDIPPLTIPNQYFVNAFPYSEKNMGGSLGTRSFVSINVLARLRVESITVIHDQTSTDVITLSSRASNAISLTEFGANATFSIRANVIGRGKSVRFELYQYRSSSTISGSLIGSGVDNRRPFVWRGSSQLSFPGFYGIFATPFSGVRQFGTRGTPILLRLSVSE